MWVLNLAILNPNCSPTHVLIALLTFEHVACSTSLTKNRTKQTEKSPKSACKLTVTTMRPKKVCEERHLKLFTHTKSLSSL